jgi:hypothetical protein
VSCKEQGLDHEASGVPDGSKQSGEPDHLGGDIQDKDRTQDQSVKNSQFSQPLFEFSDLVPECVKNSYM